MNKYYPDRWLVVKISSSSGSHYRVFGSWYGGFANGDSWKLNSGIESVELDSGKYLFKGSSGSVYCCDSSSYGIHSYGHGVLSGLIATSKESGSNIEILDESTDWLSLEYK